MLPSALLCLVSRGIAVLYGVWNLIFQSDGNAGFEGVLEQRLWLGFLFIIHNEPKY